MNNTERHTGQHDISKCDECLIAYLNATTTEQRAADRNEIIDRLAAQDRKAEQTYASRYER